MPPRKTEEKPDYETEDGRLVRPMFPGQWVELEGTGVEVMVDPRGMAALKYRKTDR